MSRLAAVLGGRPTSEQKARDQLRTAQEGDRAVEGERLAKSQAIERLLSVIAAVDSAEQMAAQAEAAAAAGATAWAEAGARDEDSEHQALIAQAVESRRQASVAGIRAGGAQRALPAAEEAEQQAKRDCEQAGANIRKAIGGVLVALVEPAFARLERARVEYLTAWNEIRGALEAEDPPGYRFDRPAAGLSQLREKLCELGLPNYVTWGEHTDAPGFAPDRWVNLAKRLATDSDAVAADVENG